jgi:hypothetical protein
MTTFDIGVIFPVDRQPYSNFVLKYNTRENL